MATVPPPDPGPQTNPGVDPPMPTTPPPEVTPNNPDIDRPAPQPDVQPNGIPGDPGQQETG